jgi:TatD DNase family protein
MPLFDTHAHLDDEQFSDVASVVETARETGVEHIVAIGTTAISSRDCVQLANEFDGVYAAVGIQPNYTQEAKPGDWGLIEQLVEQPGVVAVGETGLDHYWDYADLEIQRDYFRRHIRLAQRLKLPLVIHMRDPKRVADKPPSRACGEDICQILTEAADDRPVRGIMHSYSGDLELARRFLDLGLYISFAGMVTYKKSDELRSVAKVIPDDRILIETDAPYLSPHPVRGTRPNEPALVTHTAQCLAEVRGVSFEELAEQTTLNAKTIFGLKATSAKT